MPPFSLVLDLFHPLFYKTLAVFGPFFYRELNPSTDNLHTPTPPPLFLTKHKLRIGIPEIITDFEVNTIFLIN